jgi:hypothetical protein
MPIADLRLPIDEAAARVIEIGNRQLAIEK